MPSWRVTIKIPGLVGAAGGEIKASEAAARTPFVSKLTLTLGVDVEVNDVPIPFEEATLALLCVGASAGVSCGTGSSGLIVEVDVERLNPLVSGAR